MHLHYRSPPAARAEDFGATTDPRHWLTTGSPSESSFIMASSASCGSPASGGNSASRHLPQGYLRLLGKRGVPGRVLRVSDVLAADDAEGGMRHSFLARLRADPQCLREYGRTFQVDGRYMRPAEAAKDYQERVRVGPRHRITEEDATTCTDFFDCGAIRSRAGDQVTIELHAGGGLSLIHI